ncbi:hypothetical protein K2173_013549 [Erythroxylum novogranatense]|uniref:CBS domain-containing protein n=1 Tax=Erythroxylum novogranatense TaxID=1862640 RepID=A0AAV8TJN0_9ROSI|nr:hypothetical protein K2173_013549 [Erythroxylum novogranatense]
MQESKSNDLRKLEDAMKGQESGSLEEKKETIISHFMGTGDKEHQELDPGTALQTFFDHIPINSIPGIKNSPVVELKTGGTVKDAILLLYEKNVFGAPIADVLDPDTTKIGRFTDRYIGFIDIGRMVLWWIEESERVLNQTRDVDDHKTGKDGIFDLLEQNPEICQTKVGELAKSFLWDPFLPVRLEDTLFHVLLLLSKHRVQFVPVIDQSNFQIAGVITQIDVIQLLLQSSGLEWFDGIADKAISEFSIEGERFSIVYGDQILAEALRILWESRVGAVPVLDRRSQKLIGCIRDTDIHLLFENNELFNNRKIRAVEEFIQMEAAKLNSESDQTPEKDLGRVPAPRMNRPVTIRRSTTLKQAMKNLSDTKNSFCFVVDDSEKPVFMITLRDIIVQFAPPCIDSGIHGGGFFETALEQAGCKVKNGTMICDRK